MVSKEDKIEHVSLTLSSSDDEQENEEECDGVCADDVTVLESHSANILYFPLLLQPPPRLVLSVVPTITTLPIPQTLARKIYRQRGSCCYL